MIPWQGATVTTLHSNNVKECDIGNLFCILFTYFTNINSSSQCLQQRGEYMWWKDVDISDLCQTQCMNSELIQWAFWKTVLKLFYTTNGIQSVFGKRRLGCLSSEKEETERKVKKSLFRRSWKRFVSLHWSCFSVVIIVICVCIFPIIVRSGSLCCCSYPMSVFIHMWFRALWLWLATLPLRRV